MTDLDLDRTDWPDLDVEEILDQERDAVLPSFSVDDAHWLGRHIVELAGSHAPDVTVNVRHGRRRVFMEAGADTALDNESWVERKSNVVERLDMASLRANREWGGDEEAFYANKAVERSAYAIHGGAFPIRVRGVGLVGVATCSGLVSEADHTLVLRGVLDLKERLTTGGGA